MIDLTPVEAEVIEKPPKFIRLHCDPIFSESFVEEVVEELKLKAPCVKMGLDTVSKTDQFAFTILEAKGYFPTDVELFSEPRCPND